MAMVDNTDVVFSRGVGLAGKDHAVAIFFAAIVSQQGLCGVADVKTVFGVVNTLIVLCLALGFTIEADAVALVGGAAVVVERRCRLLIDEEPMSLVVLAAIVGRATVAALGEK